jgi:hypothetical protein
LAAEQGVFDVVEPWVVTQNRLGFELCGMEQSGVGELCHLEVGRPTLARPKELTWPTQLEVDFGEAEAITGFFHGGKPFGGDLVVAVADQDTVALVGTTADASAELVELC